MLFHNVQFEIAWGDVRVTNRVVPARRTLLTNTAFVFTAHQSAVSAYIRMPTGI